MIKIKETTPDDIKHVQALWADGDVMQFVGFPEGLHESNEDMLDWYKWIENNRPVINHYSIFEDDIYLGEAFYEIDPDTKSAALDIKLFRFARGRGIAQKGLIYVINKAFNNGAKVVWVDPNPKNRKAVALYTKLGFKQIDFPDCLAEKNKEGQSIYMELRPSKSR